MSDDPHDYLPRVRELAGALVGRRLLRVLRLLDIEADGDPRRE